MLPPVISVLQEQVWKSIPEWRGLKRSRESKIHIFWNAGSFPQWHLGWEITPQRAGKKKAALVSRLSLVPWGWNSVTIPVLFKGDSDWKGQNPTSNKPRLAKTQLRSTFIFHLWLLLISFRSGLKSFGEMWWKQQSWQLKIIPLTRFQVLCFPWKQGRDKAAEEGLGYLRFGWFKVWKPWKNLGFVLRNHISQRWELKGEKDEKHFSKNTDLEPFLARFIKWVQSAARYSEINRNTQKSALTQWNGETKPCLARSRGF